VVKNGSNTLVRFSSVIPQPLSATRMRADSSSRSTSMSTFPGLPPVLSTAFRRMLMNTWDIWSGTSERRGSSSPTVTEKVTAFAFFPSFTISTDSCSTFTRSVGWSW